MYTINLKLQKSFNGVLHETTLKGFYFKYKNNIYIFSTHHNLPIDNILYNDIEDLEIIINSKWSNVLILNGNNYNNIFKLYNLNLIQNKIPPIDSIINMIDYNLKIIGCEFIPFDNIDGQKIPFIKCELLIKNDIDFTKFKGLSGTPIFFNNKIIGTFSHYNKETKYIYILPIYIYIKNLKKDNDVYTCNYNINKIGRYNVKELDVHDKELDDNIKYIYYNKLNIHIPLTTYFLLELDSSNILINIKDNNYILKNINSLSMNDIELLQIKKICDIKTTNILLKNNNDIEIENNIYTINSRLLQLMRTFEILDNEIIYKLVLNNGKKFSIK